MNSHRVRPRDLSADEHHRCVFEDEEPPFLVRVCMVEDIVNSTYHQ